MCSIPINGTVDCLNISVACGIMLYEAAKNDNKTHNIEKWLLLL